MVEGTALRNAINCCLAQLRQDDALKWRADDSGEKFWTIKEIIDGFAVCPVYCPFCE